MIHFVWRHIEKFIRMIFECSTSLYLIQTPYIFQILKRVYLSSYCKKAAKIFRII